MNKISFKIIFHCNYDLTCWFLILLSSGQMFFYLKSLILDNTKKKKKETKILYLLKKTISYTNQNCYANITWIHFSCIKLYICRHMLRQYKVLLFIFTYVMLHFIFISSTYGQSKVIFVNYNHENVFNYRRLGWIFIVTWITDCVILYLFQ